MVLPFEIKEDAKPPSKRKRAPKIPNPLKSDAPNTSDGSVKLNLAIDDTITEVAKSNVNPEFELFEGLVDTIRRSVRKEVDYRKSIDDTSPESIKKYTEDAIKKKLRASKWA